MNDIGLSLIFGKISGGIQAVLSGGTLKGKIKQIRPEAHYVEFEFKGMTLKTPVKDGRVDFKVAGGWYRRELKKIEK